MRTLNRELLQKTLQSRLEEDLRYSRVSGARVLVMQEGKPVCDIAGGYQNWDEKIPVTDSTLFRLASMTKPVTAMAALIAVEKGWFALEDLLSDHMSEFSHMQVAKVKDGKIIGTEAVKNPLRIWHLLSHCNGMMSSDPIGWEIGEATPAEAFGSLQHGMAQPLTRWLPQASDSGFSHS